ncbi:MAG: hypothetical protein ABI867_30135 [Kofleriaceae bacterium]
MRIALVASLFAIGCGASSGGDTEPGTDEPIGTPEDPQPARTGPYQVRNTIDFTVEAIVPAQVELVVATLREFSTNPAHSLIVFADQAGVPAVGLLYGAIPGVIKDRLEGFINDEVAKLKINGTPITEYAGNIAELAELALTQFAVDSELEMKSGTATHRLTALDLEPAGLDVRVPIGGIAGDVLTQEPTLYVDEGGRLSLGEQHFGLNYGEYAWQGLEAASTALFGQGIRATLGAAVNCPNLAHTIADKCVLNVCVGHETQLREICDGGLDAIVNFTHERIAAQRLEALHLKSGAVRLVDEDGDGVGDTLVEGTWDAELNIGFGLRHAPATFEGSH